MQSLSFPQAELRGLKVHESSSIQSDSCSSSTDTVYVNNTNNNDIDSNNKLRNYKNKSIYFDRIPLATS